MTFWGNWLVVGEMRQNDISALSAMRWTGRGGWRGDCLGRRGGGLERRGDGLEMGEGTSQINIITSVSSKPNNDLLVDFGASNIYSSFFIVVKDLRPSLVEQIRSENYGVARGL